MINEKVGRLMMSGVLDFPSRKQFNRVSKGLLNDKNVDTIVVEMSQITDIGTSGIGMLYLLKERCTAQKKVLRLQHPVGKVREWLLIANSDNSLELDVG
jgi:anti-anti-sigma regulatory factor